MKDERGKQKDERGKAIVLYSSAALLAFMRTGNPNVDCLPQWPVYKSGEGATMYLDDECKVVMAPDAETLKTLIP